MRNPFPGMDPYLETPAYWPDFHQRFITYWCDLLAERLPDQYEARIDERVNLVEAPHEEVKRIIPDLAITQREREQPSEVAEPTTTATLTAAEPVSIPMAILDDVHEGYIKILHRPDKTLVTVLELLSPTNKSDIGHGDYLAKRREVIRQGVNLVEVDLLTQGHRIPLLLPLPTGDYYVIVARSDNRPNCDVYAWNLRQPLPTIPIPLKPPDPPILLNLGQVFSLTYERGRYGRSFDYTQPPPTPLNETDIDWVAERIQTMKRQSAPPSS
jgi:hypothetical protein